MKTASLLLSLLASVLLNGCIGIVPVPPNSETPPMFTAITSDQAKRIKAGLTRDEVIAMLGDQFRESPHTPVLAYSWERPAWGYAWWFFFITPEAIVAGGDYDEGNVWSAFFVKFDDAGRVVKTKFAKLDNNRSLDEQMESWAWNEPSHFLEDGAGVFNPKTGTPRAFDWTKDNLQIWPTR